ncbi:unnamed protein product [Prorocentrum cordatum]|uniref:EF-hand domain-containing protein n=1 Tax=Prorocentrum cordatum TaxID=2364126 RepID=A0ABN9UC67_9DINO|nr:unnamed protein product [Polarella glacialis]
MLAWRCRASWRGRLCSHFDSSCSWSRRTSPFDPIPAQISRQPRVRGGRPGPLGGFPREVSDLDKSSSQSGQGQLDFNEFLEIMTAKMSEKDSKEQIQKAFQLFKGPSGKISFEDLKAVAKELGEQMSDEELMEMIREADKDEDHEVSEEEFMRIIRKSTL